MSIPQILMTAERCEGMQVMKFRNNNSLKLLQRRRRDGILRTKGYRTNIKVHFITPFQIFAVSFCSKANFASRCAPLGI